MKKYLIPPHSKVRLSHFDPNDSGDFPSNEKGRDQAEAHTQKILTKLDQLQERLYASASHALLIVLQAVDTGGKDGVIKHVMSGVNPQGCRVSSFKLPTPLELSHDFLWRAHQQVPPKGYIGIFNRSYFEDVLVTRVHGQISKETAKKRCHEINDFEQLLSQNGTVILKFFLHISKEEQRKRLEERIKDPQKHWKFSLNDLQERRCWPKYRRAFQDVIAATSTKHAPWYLIPANHKWYRNWVIGKIILQTLEGMKLKFPPTPPGVDFKKIKIK
jgi:PPK2 family polyphosphate:nucleotide phosphotransferase